MGFFDGIGAGLASGGLSMLGGVMANQANAGQSQSQMDFQSHMSSTSHQREVMDLRAAGLNPILSANAGASTPAGAAANMQNALGAGVSSAVDTMRLKNDQAAVGSTIGLQTAQGAAQKAGAMRDIQTAKESAARTVQIEALMPAMKAKASVEEQQSKWTQKSMAFDNWTRMLGQGLNVGQSAKDFVNPTGFLKGIVNPWKSGGIKPWQGRTGDGTIYNKGTGEIVP